MHGSSGTRSPGLDGLRGLAILMVLLTHYGSSLNRASLPQHVVRSIFDFGWTGVDLFFVLSGFLITGILLRTKEAENYFSAFYTRRVLRIFPLYYTSLIVMFFLVMPNLPGAPPPLVFWRKIAYFVYVQNWLPPAQWMGQYWTLAVEEQFYLLWPLVVFCARRERILTIAVGASALAVLLRFALLALHVDSESILENTFTRMDALLIGAACACLMREGAWATRLRRHANRLCFIPVIVMAAIYAVDRNFYRESPLMGSIGYTLIDLSFAALLLALVATPGEPSVLQRFFGSATMRALGKYSYAAYIWHILVRVLAGYLERDVLHVRFPWFLNIPLLVALTVAASMLSYAIIERPVLSLKRYFEPRFAGAKAKAATVTA